MLAVGNNGDVLTLAGGVPTWAAPTSSGWSLTGNSGTTAGTNSLGTTDDVSLNFRVNNTKAGHIGNNTDNSVFLGLQAGFNDDGTDNRNTFIGTQAGYSNTTGYENTANGYMALYSNTTGYENTANGFGALSFNTTGSYNTANGNRALYLNTDGTFNTATGNVALYSNTTGNSNTANGNWALYSNITGNYNVALGRASGFGATGISFNQCTFVGASSFPTVARTNVTMLGYGITNAECTGDNQVLLGNTAITQIRAQVGTITTYSDKRFKTNIAEDVKGLDFITRLRPVSYNENPEILHQIWETPDSLVKEIDHSQIKNTRFVGLIAQEVDQAMKESGYTHFPGIDIPRNEHETYSLRYGDFIMPMIKAIQELKQENNTLKQENKHLKDRINKIEELLKVKSNFNPTHQE